MNLTKVMTGLMSVAALTLVTASASMAALGQFDFTTTFTPNPISGSPFGNFITVTDNSATNQQTPSQLLLSNFVETSNVAPPSNVPVNTNFNVALTITPNGGAAQTQNFTGNIQGQYNTNTTLTMLVSSAPSSLVYNFGSLGTYTFSNLQFVGPGITSSSQKGALQAFVTYTPPTQTPEPATVVPFALGGLGLLGLIVRKPATRVAQQPKCRVLELAWHRGNYRAGFDVPVCKSINGSPANADTDRVTELYLQPVTPVFLNSQPYK